MGGSGHGLVRGTIAISAGWTEENHKNHQSGLLVLCPNLNRASPDCKSDNLPFQSICLASSH
jgi:hypothetical protein